ncbi:MAG: rod shape-determining protein RodA [Oscillospiraceae bacterium]|nr:rod shape-determining protein RodA [Candidatus Ruminococcus equi]
MNTFTKKLKNFFTKTDGLLWMLSLAAIVFSILLISSMQRTSEYNFLVSQIVAIIIGYFLAICISLVEYENILKYWIVFGVIGLLLIILVFVFGFNVTGTDDTAWIRLPGGLSFQPSELIKLIFIITFTKHLQILKEKNKLTSLFGVLSLLLHMAIPVVLIHFQGDDGTVLVFIFMFLIMAFVGGVQIRYFLIMLLAFAVSAPIIWKFFLNDEHKNRFIALFDLDGNSLTNYGWQQYQGKVSIASGGLYGEGLGNGMRVSSQIVPEQENDFIFTVAGEELGFIGCILLLTILVAIIVKIIINATKARDYTGKMICVGVFSMIFTQTVVNIGMVLGFLPVVGITLPFFSSGGTSILSVLIGIGLVQSVYYHKDESVTPDGVIKSKKYKYKFENQNPIY